jgi:hypothetical protein
MMPNNPASDDSDEHIAQREAQVADEPAQPRRLRAGQVQQVHNVAGLPDVFVEGAPARQVRRGRRYAPDMSAYRGHERPVIANLEDDPEAGA